MHSSPNQQRSAVRCQALSKTYRAEGVETPALRGVELEVLAGELTMLVGPSGCGKTTLISVIAGILNYDSGSCEVFQEDFQQMTDRERTRWRGANVGFVFQSFNLIPTLSAAENVAVPLLIQGNDRASALRRASALLEQVGLGDRLRSKPRQLSGGQQQRVAIARALVHEPRLIVCDEPTSALDNETGKRIIELLREVALKPDRSLIIVTHDSRVFRFADRIAVMDDGVIQRVETPPFERDLHH